MTSDIYSHGPSSQDDLSPQVRGRLSGEQQHNASWRVAAEVPLVMFYNSEQFGVMMLTPADFEDFAIGFTLTEGIVTKASQIKEVRLETVREGMAANVIVPKEALEIARNRKRTITGGSSCGICGAQTLEAALPRPDKTNGLMPTAKIVLMALNALSSKQVFNQQNFSTHAAALVDGKGKIILLREDVGRHNALDKLCGAMTKANLGTKNGFLILSSRFSVEMAQKAAKIGFSFVASVSAPTALALKISAQASMKVATLSGNSLMVFD